MPEKERTLRKGYCQECPLSTALEIAGDRWTPLILRELLGGPARFNQIQEGLPGIAKNLLTTRLRRLEEDGVLRRERSQDVWLYSLTEDGEAIRPALEELGFWGARLARVSPAKYGRSIRAVAMALQAILVRAKGALPESRYIIELKVDDEVAEILLAPNPVVSARTSPNADSTVQVAMEVVASFLMGQSFEREKFQHRSGDREATRHLLDAFEAMALGSLAKKD